MSQCKPKSHVNAGTQPHSNDDAWKQKKRMSTRLVIPFLVEIINESVFVVVATRTTAALVAEGNAAVTSAGGEEASTGGSEDYEHVLITMLAIDCG